MKWRFALAAALAPALAACFSGSSAEAPDAASACPSDVPASCPAVVPSWSGEVQAIVDRHCGQCHTDGGVEAKVHPFDTYAHVYTQRTSILTQVVPCKMPPPEGTPLDTEERAALLGWLVCHAPQN